MSNIENFAWLHDNMDGLKEKIIFRDRIEYRISGELHNSKGPAIIYTYDGLHKTTPDADNFEEYYLKGIKMTKEQWSINIREIKLKRIIKKTKKGNNNE